MKALQEALAIKFKELLKSKDPKINNPQKAAEIIKKEYFATGPDKKNLKKSARDFKKKYGYTLKRNPFDEQIFQKRMKHVEACFDATLEVAKETAMKQIILDEIAQKQLKSADVKLKKGTFVNTFRSLHDLMHLNNTTEAKMHNEKVVSLMLYNQGLITKDQFITLRVKQMKETGTKGAVDFAILEADNPKKSLLDLIKAEVASLQKEAEYAEKGTEEILNFNQNNPEKLKKAFHAVEASRADLLRTGFMIYNDNKYGWGKNETQEEKDWVKENLDNYGCRNSIKYGAVDGMSNPYMAIMDTTEMIECFNSGKIKKIDDDYSALGRYRYDIGEQFSPHVLLAGVENDRIFNTKLEVMGMQGAESTSYAHGFTVYKKGDDILVTRDTVRSLMPFKMERRMAEPTELFKANAFADVTDLYEQYKECNTGKGSHAYDNMERALKNVMVATENFPKDTSKSSLDGYKKIFDTLQKKAKEYLEHKENDFRRRRIQEPEGGYKNHSQLAKNSYEKKRIELAESILKFTKSKMEAIEIVKQYKDTLDKQEELSNDVNPVMNQPELMNAAGDAEGKDENKKEDPKEKNQEGRVPTNYNEMVKQKDKEEGNVHKKRAQRSFSSDDIMKENPIFQMDSLAKK